MHDGTLNLLSRLCNDVRMLQQDYRLQNGAAGLPKKAGVDVIEKQRPLELQEPLKKEAVGIRKDKVARAWERLGVCDASQFAFLRGRSAIQPAVIKRLLLESPPSTIEFH
jgi:hypothetical protein